MSAPRYLLLLMQPGADCAGGAQDIARRTGLTQADAPDGAVFLCNTPALSHSASRTGLLVGHLFDRRRFARVPSPDPAIADAPFDTLLADYWGGYVAIHRAPSGDEIFRDPSGALPCYHVALADGVALASDPQTLCDAGLLVPDIDQASLSRHLFQAGLPSTTTVLQGLSEVPPGSRLRTGPGRIEALWSPWAFASGRATAGKEPTAKELQLTIQNCIGAWAGQYRKVLIGISGGLDSSIVASCLSRTQVDIVAATLTTTDPEGDERPYARALAESLQVELIEAAYAHELIDITRSAAAHLPRPIARTQVQAHDATMLALGQQHAIGAFFSGNGGDNVFCLLQSARPLVDRLLHAGPGPGALRTLLDTCRMTGCSPVQALRLASGISWSGDRGYQWKGDASFLSRDALALNGDALHHPWLVPPAHGLPGKAAHIAMLLRAQMTLEGFDRQRGPITINPLMSQPVMETCLAISSWRWSEGGMNRAVARQAFAQQLPERIVKRRSKGGPDGFSIEIFERNRTRIAERLLDGNMVRQGLLDRSALAEALRDRGPTLGGERVRILALLDTEAWLDHWATVRTSMRTVSPARQGDAAPHR